MLYSLVSHPAPQRHNHVVLPPPGSVNCPNPTAEPPRAVLLLRLLLLSEAPALSVCRCCRPCAATTTRRPVSAAAPPVAAPAEASLLREKCGLFHLLRPTRLSGEEFSVAPASSPCPPLLLSHLISSPSAALTP